MSLAEVKREEEESIIKKKLEVDRGGGGEGAIEGRGKGV